MLSVATAFAIFTILATINEGLNGKLSLASAQRLDTSPTMNIALPVSYAATIRSIPGVTDITYQAGFDGYYQDPNKGVGVLAFAVPSVLKVYPEFSIPADQQTAFLHDREGAIVGDVLARKMGWHVGETVPIQGGLAQKNGSTTWMSQSTAPIAPIFRPAIRNSSWSITITSTKSRRIADQRYGRADHDAGG